MKRLLYIVVGLAAVVLLLGVGLVSYAKPQRALDLQYGEISAFDKIADMVLKRQLVLELTEADLNHLLKRVIAEHARIDENTEIKGAAFEQQGHELLADLDVELYNRMRAGVRIRYSLASEGSVLKARFQDARVRDWEVPKAWLQPPDFQVDLNTYIPSTMVAVKQLEFTDNAVRIHFGLR